MIVAQGQRGTSAALGPERKMICSPFSGFGAPAGRRAANPEKGEAGYGVASTQGGGLGGLALGYYHAAPVGRRAGELPVASFVG